MLEDRACVEVISCVVRVLNRPRELNVWIAPESQAKNAKCHTPMSYTKQRKHHTRNSYETP